MKKLFQHIDYSLLISVLALCAIGLVMIYSASFGVSVTKYEVSPNFFFIRQLIFLTLGLFLFFVAIIIPYPVYKRFMGPIVFICIGLLLFVLVFGRMVNGAKSWVYIGSFAIQPGEFVKLGLAIYFAGIFSKKQERLDQFAKSILPPLSIFLVIFMLIMKEPDLGTAMIAAGVAGTILMCSGIRWKQLGILGIIALVACTFLYFHLSQNQLSRFDAAYHPFNDPAGKGYQLVNAYIALADGGINGRGLGQGIQKYGFLPEPHTDFIISTIGEELGFWGVAAVILLLGFIVLKGFYTGLKGNDINGSLLAFGISGMIGIQTFVNLGAAIGLLPITGVPLPFISYGGSSLLLFMTSMGILINISAHVRYKSKHPTQQPLPKQKGNLRAV